MVEPSKQSLGLIEHQKSACDNIAAFHHTILGAIDGQQCVEPDDFLRKLTSQCDESLQLVKRDGLYEEKTVIKMQKLHEDIQVSAEIAVKAHNEENPLVRDLFMEGLAVTISDLQELAGDPEGHRA